MKGDTEADGGEEHSEQITVDEAVGIVQDGDGAVIDGVRFWTEGEGRQTRYFHDGGDGGKEKVKKGGVEAAAEAAINSGAAIADADEADADGEADPKAAVARAADRGDTVNRSLAVSAIEAHHRDGGGFFAEDGGEEKVVSMVDFRPMGYITGSHVEASPAPVDGVGGYKIVVAEALDIDPDEVPTATEGMREKFASGGHELDEEQKAALSEKIQNRWDEGEYDHLRGPDGDG